MNAPTQLIALDRNVIEELAEAHLAQADALIALLDQTDGDPDLEDDDLYGECSEDEISTGPALGMRFIPDGPGCPIADPGGCEHDGREPEEEL